MRASRPIIPIVLALSGVLTAAGGPEPVVQWLAISEAQPASLARASLVATSDAGLDIEVTAPGAFTTAIPVDRTEYVQLSIPGCGATAEQEGWPELPFKGFFVEIPYGVDVSVELLDDTVMSLGHGFHVYPKQPALPDSEPEPAFVVDTKAYATDAFFPPQPVSLDEPAFIRGRRVVFVQVFPLRYNPVTTELQAFKDLRFRLVYSGTADIRGVAERRRVASPESEALAADLLLNYEPVPQPVGIGRPLGGRDGADYLIICKDTLVEEIQPLVTYKQLFHTVKVKKWSEIGTTAAQLKTYIQDAYDDWDPVPEYVLIVGDSGDIPSHYVANVYCYSDVKYACVSGADYYPDLAIGRLPVSTETDCTNVINKIVNYERYPLDDDYYTHFLSAGYFQDDGNDGTADRWFMETSAHVENFVSGKGMTTHTAWCTNSGAHANYHYRADGYPHRFAYADPVPAAVTGAWVTAANATAAITTNINNGMGHVLHRDHGSETAWGDPPYGINDINNLNNGNKTPVVFSINCMTGTFTRGGGDCFCEAFLKKNPGGCAGIIGATRISYSGYNDLMVHGMYKSFWNDYDNAHADATYARSWRLGPALNYGKYYMQVYEGTSWHTEAEFYMFHLFGDPDMWLRRYRPMYIDAQFRGRWTVGQHTLTVVIKFSGKGEPVSDAVVSIRYEGSGEVWTGVTNADGEVEFGIEFMSPSGYFLTVDAPDCIAYDEPMMLEGACCTDTPTPQCQEMYPLPYCYGRWAQGSCGSLNPPCGQGACCRDTLPCFLAPSPTACTGSDRVWLGYGVPCSECCVLTCPTGGIQEGESCGASVNNTCATAKAVSCGQTICGTLWANGGAWDEDWFKIVTMAASNLSLTLNAELPVQLAVMDSTAWGNPDCGYLTGRHADYDRTTPCNPTGLETLCLPPGTYYVKLWPDATTGYPCNTQGRNISYFLNFGCVTCSAVSGACCDDATETCTEGVHEVNCQGTGLRWLPAPATCASFDPPCGAPVGVCCDDDTGTCADGIYQYNCAGNGLRWLEAPATCADFAPPCGPPWGTCCHDLAMTCDEDIYYQDCQGADDRFLAAPADCSDCWITLTTGACCDDLKHTCEEGVYEVNCRMPWMRFLPAPATCDDFDPPCIVAARGACCVGWVCSVLTSDECSALCGRYMGDDTTCDPNPCPITDTVVCEPQPPNHPPTYWYEVTPGNFGRCDFHVQVFDPEPANYTSIVMPTNWVFQVHTLPSGEVWASWWDPTTDCQNAIFGSTMFGFSNSNPSTWGHWSTTIGNSNDPYWCQIDSSVNHPDLTDGYGYRVHVPTPAQPGACCAPDGSCTETTETGCAFPSYFLGDGTTCDPNPCTPFDYALTVVGGLAVESYPAWYLYPNTWWNAWWPNEYAPDRLKEVTLTFTIDFVTPPPVVAFNYAREDWDSATSPPLPADDEYVVREPVEPPITAPGTYTRTTLLPFCPRWVSVDVQGSYFTIRGSIVHVCLAPEWCLGDMNCSGGSPTFDDIKYFSAAIGSESSWWAYYRLKSSGVDPPCAWLLGDYNMPRNGVEFSDIKPFAASIGQPCIPFVP